MKTSSDSSNQLILLLALPVLAYLSTRQVFLSVTSWQEWLMTDYLGRALILVYVLVIPSVRAEVCQMFRWPWPKFRGFHKAIVFFCAICGVLLLEWLINHVRLPVYELFPETVLFRYYEIEAPFWLTFDLVIGLVLVAISEEILFRGCLFRILGHFLSNPFFIVAVSAIIFGLMHWPSGFHNIAAASLSGIVFGALYLWSKSLIPGVLAHYLVNWAHFWPS